MTKISNFFYNKSTLVIAIALTIITFSYLFFVMMDAAQCFEVVDSGQKSLGTSFGFSYEMVQDFFSIRSEAMMLCYKKFNLIWDNLFALFYGLMYTCWVSLLLKPYAAKVKWLNLLPISQAIFDWLENFQVANLAHTFLTAPPISAFNVQLASLFSMAKWIASTLIFLIIIVGIGFRINSLLQKRKLYKN